MKSVLSRVLCSETTISVPSGTRISGPGISGALPSSPNARSTIPGSWSPSGCHSARRTSSRSVSAPFWSVPAGVRLSLICARTVKPGGVDEPIPPTKTARTTATTDTLLLSSFYFNRATAALGPDSEYDLNPPAVALVSAVVDGKQNQQLQLADLPGKSRAANAGTRNIVRFTASHRAWCGGKTP